MAQCVNVGVDNVLIASNEIVDNCQGLVLLNTDEYQLVISQNVVLILEELFAFQLDVFSIVCGASLVMFLVSHGAGSVVRWLGR